MATPDPEARIRRAVVAVDHAGVERDAAIAEGLQAGVTWDRAMAAANVTSRRSIKLAVDRYQARRAAEPTQ